MNIRKHTNWFHKVVSEVVSLVGYPVLQKMLGQEILTLNFFRSNKIFKNFFLILERFIFLAKFNTYLVIILVETEIFFKSRNTHVYFVLHINVLSTPILNYFLSSHSFFPSLKSYLVLFYFYLFRVLFYFDFFFRPIHCDFKASRSHEKILKVLQISPYKSNGYRKPNAT